MRIVYFSHSLKSCWNHGNAHFQRGVLRELQKNGHSVLGCEPRQSWSRDNLVAERGEKALSRFTQTFSDLALMEHDGPEDIEKAVNGADLVLVHEWNEPSLVAAIGHLRSRQNFTLLFHDTHHRAVSDPNAIRHFDLSQYDGVLAFGATLARVYQDWGWRNRVFVWHEAADTALFFPRQPSTSQRDVVWVGNWGDGERTDELENFLFAPAQKAGLTLDVHGVRYPEAALALLGRYHVRFNGWIANIEVPEIFAAHRLTVHIPRRQYATILPGIPTIRVFEALACGIPLVSAPWEDCEGLFRPGLDYVVGRSPEEMQAHMRRIVNEPGWAAEMAERGIERLATRHSCAIRAKELIEIVHKIKQQSLAA